MSSNRSAIDTNSLNILNIQLIPSISWVLLGLFGSVGSFLLFLVICTNHKCRSNFYFCLMHVAIADTVYCLTTFICGLKRLILLALTLPESCSPTECLWVFIPLAIAKNVSLAQAAVVGFDRLLGVSMPLRYKSFEIKHLQVANLVMWVLPTVVLTYQMIVSVSTAPIIASCAIGQIWLPVMGSVSSGLGLAWEILSIIVYSLLLAVLLHRIYTSKHKGHQTMDQLKQSGQYRSAMTGFMILGVFTGVAMTGDIFILGTNGLSASDKPKIQPYGNSITLLASNLNFLICVLRNKDVQRPILNIITCRRLFMRSGQIAPESQISEAHALTINAVRGSGKNNHTTTTTVI